MEKEKIQQFFELLDGVTESEWRILSRKADMLYEMKASTNKLHMTGRAVAYMTDDTVKTLSVLDGIKSEAKQLTKE